AHSADGDHAAVRLLRRLEHRRQLPHRRPAAPDLQPREPGAGVNGQIRRLFFVLVTLFVAVIGMATWWLWKAPDLEARRGNPAVLVKQLTIERGKIFAANGKTILARN